MSDQPGLEKQAISQAIKLGLSNQLDNAENIEVHVETDLLKIAQGKVDSISVEGQGVTIYEGIHLKSIEVQTDQVSINLLKAILGDIRVLRRNNLPATIENRTRETDCFCPASLGLKG